ncbi:MAG: ATP-dependent DNA helicase DinG [Pseudomonadota bacterium]
MLSSDVKQRIQAAYTQFLESKGWGARHSQRIMIAEIAKSIGAIEYNDGLERVSNKHCCVVEAGTGTGKTLAYTLATIPLAQALDKRVIIATATVALQEQILYKDLPSIQQHSGLTFTFALAKGRRRYVCLSRLDKQLQSEPAHELLHLYPDEMQQAAEKTVQASLCESMLNGLSSGEWNGDRDTWSQPLDDEEWLPLTADRNQCTGRHCSFVSQCSFFKARDALEKVDCVVANHDLVLSDLALGGGAILSEPEQSMYVFDEAHQLSAKALQHFASQVRLQSSVQWLEQVQLLPKLVYQSMGLSVPEKQCLTAASEIGMSLHAIKPMLLPFVDQVSEDSYSDEQLFRFADGVVPAELRETAGVLAQQYLRLINVLDSIHEALESSDQTDKAVWEQNWNLVAQYTARATQYQSLWRAYAQQDSRVVWARWLEFEGDLDDVDVILHASPIMAQDILEIHLWQRAFATILSSATLSSLGHFGRIQQQLGIPEGASYFSLDSPFDFNRVMLHVPSLPCDPSDVEQHTQYLIDELPNLLTKRRGSLVLFSSRRQMQTVYESLENDLREIIITQDDHAKIEVIRRHRERIDEGLNSVIFGLASFSEGVDLPGVYCQHVIIAKLPFAVPGRPIDEALADWVKQQGKNPFMEISVPDAMQALLQACGRLLRHEDDEGDITLLDKRIVTKRYGQLMLDSLPAYRRHIEL